MARELLIFTFYIYGYVDMSVHAYTYTCTHGECMNMYWHLASANQLLEHRLHSATHPQPQPLPPPLPRDATYILHIAHTFTCSATINNNNISSSSSGSRHRRAELRSRTTRGTSTALLPTNNCVSDTNHCKVGLICSQTICSQCVQVLSCLHSTLRKSSRPSPHTHFAFKITKFLALIRKVWNSTRPHAFNATTISIWISDSKARTCTILTIFAILYEVFLPFEESQAFHTKTFFQINNRDGAKIR